MKVFPPLRFPSMFLETVVAQAPRNMGGKVFLTQVPGICLLGLGFGNLGCGILGLGLGLGFGNLGLDYFSWD